ncbi:DUF3883 domain-containing protein [Nocardioides jishulii]|uniref:DUF3883 domain-containing protein n=1 Tax=Nocardioides jishulii TaxID=2575440 RepID=A0A4U2YTV9_9ACTN|nr:DUF3883 domain-containing protein [Nocardioides jishulii]QCX28487.1 DUF3883 domain-containing protein [Nocardioides jishulii]TKI64620.1 DUF3883 domain-containing protein [Nocardioides jishulii]
MAEAWTREEVSLTVDAYLSMLRHELDGRAYSKAEHRRELKRHLTRSDGSIEYKFQNISAVLMEMGGVPIPGYKPAVNVQNLLREVVAERYETDAELAARLLLLAEAPVSRVAGALGPASPVPDVTRMPRRSNRVAKHVDYQAIEARNRAVGLLGEQLVVQREKRRLFQAGHPELADRVRHVAVEDGDGLGYDVLSWTISGTERFLEVKTTRFTELQPFLVSRNEVDLSAEEPERFSLMRVFSLEKPTLGFYELPGSLKKTAELRSELYSGVPRAS